MERQLSEVFEEGRILVGGLGGAPPSMTPPVRTVVFPPSYGVTSLLDESTKMRSRLACSLRDILYGTGWGRGAEERAEGGVIGEEGREGYDETEEEEEKEET